MDALAVAIRFGLYLDLMLLYGGAAFRLHALLRESAEPQRGGAAGMFVIATLGIGLSLLGLIALAASMSGAPLTEVEGDAVTMLLRETSAGTAGILRLQALLVAAFFTLFWRRWPRNASLGVLVSGGAALATLAWTGHGAMDEGLPGWFHLVADIIHLLAAGLWIGALALLLRLALQSGPADLAHLRRLHDALERFSAIGIAVVFLLVLSGFANLLFLTGAATLGAILTSMWSWLLAAKLTLFAFMLLLAAVNRFRLTPQLAGSPDAAALRHARFSLTLESAAALLILLLVAWLGTLEPPISTV